jgi:hypothetical protein
MFRDSHTRSALVQNSVTRWLCRTATARGPKSGNDRPKARADPGIGGAGGRPLHRPCVWAAERAIFGEGEAVGAGEWRSGDAVTQL